MDLLVVAKEPVAGRVKTRLCPPCSPAEAAAIAEAALADTLAAADRSGADCVVVALDGRPGRWLPARGCVVDQGGGTFAERLATAWRATTGPALQIGMDTPQVGAGALRGAMAMMADHDAVLGLAEDGGWWALGLREPRPDVFTGVPMSSAETGRRQLDRLEALGMDVGLLPPRRDVDTWVDARVVAGLVPASRFARAVGAVASRLVPA